MRFVAAGVALVAAMSATSPAAPAAAVELAGKTEIVGSRSASMPVHLSQPASLDPSRISFEGTGRMFGFVLHRDGAAREATAFAVHVNYCLKPACVGPDDGDHFGFVAVPNRRGTGLPFDPTGTLPPGNYHVQLLADGAPVKVTILLDGLPGEVQLAPGGPAGARLSEPPADLPLPSPAQAAFSAGSTHVVGRFGGVNIGSLWVEEALPMEVNLANPCAFRGPPPALTRYQFPCPGSGEISLFPYGNRPFGPPRGPLGLLQRYRAILEFVGGFAPGTWSVGAYNLAAGPAYEGHLVQFWVDFVA